MEFANPNADIFCPGGQSPGRTTHLCIAAHQDDVEIMATAPILECYDSHEKWFSAVVVSDGAQAPRSGPYANCTDEDMMSIRAAEQRAAAQIGRYGAMFQLGYTSAQIKQQENSALIGELCNILLQTSPEVVYTHNLMDKHPTHVATAIKAVYALRALPKDKRPRRLIACEVWRGLDWLCDRHKVQLNTSARPHISAALLGVFDSQIAGGKRYDLAEPGRRLANATYFESHSTDKITGMNFGFDMTELLDDNNVSIRNFAMRFIADFQKSVEKTLDLLL